TKCSMQRILSTARGSPSERFDMKSLSTGVALVVAAICASAALSQQADVAGINEVYRDPNLQVEVWVERFETEGREAFDFREAIVADMGLMAGQAVADVGAGTGLFEPLLAARVGREGKVYAVDIVPDFVEHIEA